MKRWISIGFVLVTLGGLMGCDSRPVAVTVEPTSQTSQFSQGGFFRYRMVIEEMATTHEGTRVIGYFEFDSTQTLTNTLLEISYPMVLYAPITETLHYPSIVASQPYTHPVDLLLPASIMDANYTIAFRVSVMVQGIPHEEGGGIYLTTKDGQIGIPQHPPGGLTQYVRDEIRYMDQPVQTLIPLDAPPYPIQQDAYPAPPSLGD